MNAQMIYDEKALESIIRKYLEDKNIVVTNVDIKGKLHYPDHPGSRPSAVFDKVVVDVDIGEVVPQK